MRPLPDSHRTVRTCLLALALAAVGASPGLRAATTAPSLSPQIALRPLTPQEIKDYSLTGLQGASGLSTIGIGQPAYLEVLVSSAIPSSNVVGISWALTGQPVGSTAALAESPLGQNVPTYKMADRIATQVLGRKLLRPDVAGQYTVTATIATSSGSTNVTQTINAGTYMGANTCALCHSGGQVADNTFVGWSQTPHASMFKSSIDGLRNSSYNKNCISCHTVGYDVNTNAVNAGFDDVAQTLGWTFPATLTNGNWAAMPASLQNLSNIQCESCHGPGNEHAFSLGDPSKISASLSAGDCAQCHDSKPKHARNAEWNNSRHAIATSYPTGAGRESCVSCHSGVGFTAKMKGLAITDASYEAISCASCHDSHNATNTHQVRSFAEVKLNDGTVITKGGTGKICMECHKARVNGPTYVETTPGSTRFGPHYGTQADMLAGANAVTYGTTIPSSAHSQIVEDSCATCHMQEVAETNPAFTLAGGHTFAMSYEKDGVKKEVSTACVQCHGDVESFDFKRQDYDGDGIVQGVQTEVKNLLNKLALLLPPVGTPKTSLNITTNWTRPQLKAAYNYQFVLNDGSFGVHNLSYAVGALKASISDLTGDANQDGILDEWQIRYFGSIGNANARPDATPAGDGIPNWLKYSLAMDPTVSGTAFPGGVVLANGKDLVNPVAGTNGIAIYTAAEVVFDTEAGKSYQIQTVSALSGGWQNLGTPIAGSGSPISYVTPTRNGVQQFYRVIAQ